jgi:hypothetical protein
MMPIAVTKYRCQFKCGTNAKSSVKDAVKHENRCYKNPDNKTCSTCSNQIYEREDHMHGRGCRIDLLNDFLDELQEKLRVSSSYVTHVRPLFNCPNWNLPELQTGTDGFLWEIRPKIEQAAEFRRLANEGKATDLPF